MTLSRIRAAAIGAATVALAAGGLMVAAPSSSAATAGALTLTPTSGTGGTLLSVATDAGCADPSATHFLVTLSGVGIQRLVPSSPVSYESVNYMVGKTSLAAIGATGIGTAALKAPVSKIFSQVAAENKGGKIPNGTYTLQLDCTSAFGPAVKSFSTRVTILNGADGLTFAQGGGSAITNVTKPVITGTAQVGKTLKVSAGTWSATPETVIYQWKLSSQVICSTASCKLPAAAKNKTLTVIVTAQAAGYTPGSTSVKTAKVKP